MMASSSVGTIVLDLDGVLYLDSQGIPGAREALESASALGWGIIYATNNSTKTAEDVARHIALRTGFDADPADAITSAMSAAEYLRGVVASAAIVGEPSIAAELERVGIGTVPSHHDPGAVVVGLDRSITYDTIAAAASAVRGGALFIATNADPTYPTPSGLAPGAGTIVAAIATASGEDPVICGKPEPVFASMIRSRVGDGPLVVVGDRPETDIALGKVLGCTTILTLTGVTRTADDVPDAYRPDHVVESVSGVIPILERIRR